jgi:DNA-binding transcriptional ArsR family regulator
VATDDLSRVFAALADPTRRAMLLRLSEGEATVGELAEPFSISLPAISRHLKVLEEAGLIARDRRAQWRTNTLRPERLREATTWMEHVNRLWDGRFDRLDAYLQSIQRAPDDAPTPDPSTSHTPTGAPTDGAPTDASTDAPTRRDARDDPDRRPGPADEIHLPCPCPPTDAT